MSDESRRHGVPTMKDVAIEARVSKALVSIVFRGAPGAKDETRQRVFEAANRIGYRTNRTASLLASVRTRQIGVVHDLHNGFHAEIVEAAMAAAAGAGYQVVLSPRTRHNSEAQAISAAIEFRCEGILLIGPTSADELLPSLTSDLPTVLIGRDSEDQRFDTAAGSDEVGMKLILDHLVSLGHYRIMHVDGGSGTLAQRRRDGFLKAMKSHGLATDGVIVRGGPDEDSGREAGREILETFPDTTAIVAFNDLTALGVLDAVQLGGMTSPMDFSVVGYDDSPLARTSMISLTSIRQGSAELGSWSVRALIDKLDNGRTEPQRFVAEPSLMVRGTTSGVRSLR